MTRAALELEVVVRVRRPVVCVCVCACVCACVCQRTKKNNKIFLFIWFFFPQKALCLAMWLFPTYNKKIKAASVLTSVSASLVLCINKIKKAASVLTSVSASLVLCISYHYAVGLNRSVIIQPLFRPHTHQWKSEVKQFDKFCFL